MVEEDLVVLVAMLLVILVVLVLNYPQHSEILKVALVSQDLVELIGLLVVEVVVQEDHQLNLKMVDLVLVDHQQLEEKLQHKLVGVMLVLVMGSEIITLARGVVMLQPTVVLEVVEEETLHHQVMVEQVVLVLFSSHILFDKYLKT